MSSVAMLALLSVLTQTAPQGFEVDLHQHLTMHRGLWFFDGDACGSAVATRADQLLTNQIDDAGLDRAGLRVIAVALWVPLATRVGRSAMTETLNQIEQLRRFVERHPRFAIAKSSSEVSAIDRSGRTALLISIEGADAIERVEDVDVLYAAGVRSVGLVHFIDNPLGDAEDGQFGMAIAPLLNGREGGLSALGRKVVARMMQLGMVVDLAHTSPRTAADVLTLSEASKAPVMVSHVGSAVVAARTLDDSIASRVGQGGGLIGIGIFRNELLQPVPEVDRFSGFEAQTCDEVISHWTHYAKVAGASAVMLGSDFNSVIKRPKPNARCPNGLRTVGDLPELATALSTEAPDGVAGDAFARFMRFFERIERAADPAAQRVALQRTVPRVGFFETPF